MGFRRAAAGQAVRSACWRLAPFLGRGLRCRLSQVLREEMGAAYYVGAGNDAHADYGMFEISAGIDKQRVAEIFARIAGILGDMKHTLVSPEELSKAKEFTLGIQRMGLESSDDIAGFYGVQLIMGAELRTPADIERSYRAVTAQDIRRVARTIFTTSNTALAVVGPYETKDIDTSAFLAL